MTRDNLKILVCNIIAEAKKLVSIKTDAKNIPVNYACIFAQNEEEYDELLEAGRKMGTVVQETAMGPVFKISPLKTVAGDLELLKIRRPDPKRTERGDADFTVDDYQNFKKTHLDRPGFNIIKRPEMEMLELADQNYNVLAYFSYPTLAQVLKINRK